MKWIGQYIQDFIARFRNDVYLEDVSSGTIASGGNLGLDSNNKVVKATVSGTDGMGSGFTVSATTDSNATTITQGDDLMFTAGTGITCETTADGTVTITNTVSDTNTQLSNAEVRAAVEAATDSNVFTDADHTKLNGVAASANNYSLPSANETTVGGVELATTSEANTGTDTARAVTPAGLESHVNARYSYQYITFEGNSDNTSWTHPGVNGPGNWNWNEDSGVTDIEVGSTTISVARTRISGNLVIPYGDVVLVGFYGIIRNDNNNNQGALGIFHAPFSDYGAKTTATNFTLRAYGQGDTAHGGGSSHKGNCKVVALSANYSLSAGDVLIPAMLETTADKVFMSMTIVLKTLIPT